MIKDNVKDVFKRIKAAAEKTGRQAHDIKLVCVTKNIDAYRINEAATCGITDIGENRVQEALSKKPAVFLGVKWHLVGHLQTNKAKDAIQLFDLIHSVDSTRLAHKIDKESKLIDKIQDVLIQINTSGEGTKYGISPEEIINFLNASSGLQNLKIKGLMTITPIADNPESVRPYLKELKELFDSIKADYSFPNVELQYLSMGMSQDFEVAIEEGANMVRIGTAIFKE